LFSYSNLSKADIPCPVIFFSSIGIQAIALAGEKLSS